MSEEIVPEVVAEVPAPEQVATAAPETEDTPQPEVKVFTQEELDAAIGKRLAREQRKWERERQQAAPVIPAEAPTADQFETVEEYAEALAERKAEELLHQRALKQQQAEFLDTYHDREEEARGKYDDFEQVAYNPSLRITDVMAQTIQASEIGPDVAYFLGSNPKEADRISRLVPLLQAKEIGKLEAKLASDPPVKKVSSAPAPITPIRGGKVNAPAVYDTTDPRSIKSMSTSEWIAAERLRQIKKMEASNKFR